MSDGASDITIAQDEAYEIRPSEINAVLQSLWRDTLGEELDAAVVHVRTLNLLVFVPQALATSELRRAIDTLALTHPGRAITMIVSDDEHPLRAHASIACRLNNGGKQVCGEQITLECGQHGDPLPSIAAALLTTDVPTFLWWLGDPPFDSPIFDGLVESVDRVLVDSRTWRDPLAPLPALIRTVNHYGPHVTFADLLWAALTPWRQFVAQSFDLPRALPHLSRLRRVEVEHGASPGDRLAAALFVGWLGSRLGWRLGEHGGDTLAMDSDHGPVEIALTSGEATSLLNHIRLASDDAEIVLAAGEHSCVTTSIALPDTATIERMTRLAAVSLDRAVGEELNLIDRDRGYEDALAIAIGLIGKQPS